MLVRMSRFWSTAYRVQYRFLALLDPLIRAVWRRFGVGNVVELSVPSRRGGRPRSRLVGLLHAGQGRYIGHPNGHVGWTRDLAVAGAGVLSWPDGAAWSFRAHILAPGDEREAAIRATSQHPFPGNLVYRLGRRHIRAVGVFFRLHETP